MSTSEGPNATTPPPKPTPPPEQPTVRFRQLCKVSADTLLALSDEGGVYRREFNEDSEAIVWQRLPTVTSTHLEARPCTYPGCDFLFEVLPGGADIPDQCRVHQYGGL